MARPLMLHEKDLHLLKKRLCKSCHFCSVIEKSDENYIHAKCWKCSAPIKIEQTLEEKVAELEEITQQLTSDLIVHKQSHR